MKKSRVIIGLVVILALAAYFTLGSFLGSIVRQGVDTFGPKLTKTKVTLADAHISPFTGSGTLTGLYVGNPEGWNSPKAFSFAKIHVDMEPLSVFGDHIVINEIIIDQPEFVYETKIISSNIGDLLDNIENYTSGGGQVAKTKDGKPIKFVVKKFRLTHGKVTLGAGASALPLPLPPISLDNLGVKEGGITPDQLATVVIRSVLGGIATSTAHAATKIGSTTGSAASNAVEKAGESIKNLFNK